MQYVLMTDFQEIPKPNGNGRLSTNEILGGQITPPIERMRSLSEDAFEDLVLEWADGYLQKKYSKIRGYGGAGDKGRDIVCYYPDGKVDLYQCKRYSTVLSPSHFWVELGKLMFYTSTNEYPIPKSYFIVTTKGVGPTLLDLIQNPTKFNDLLISEWEDKCKTKIKKGNTELTDELQDYIKRFDFSIIEDKAPLELINEHKQTTYYPQRFGGGLIKYRNIIPSPSLEIQEKELNYTELLFCAYSKTLEITISNSEDLKNNGGEFVEHFEEERSSFYCAESLDKFSRDNFADLSKLPFDEMKEDSLAILKSQLRLSNREADLDRLEESKLTMMTQAFSSNALHKEIRNLDKAGMCHYLANERKIKWEK